MYVCICKQINEQRIQNEYQKGSCYDDIEKQLGLGSGCGECKRYAADYYQKLKSAQTKLAV